MNNDSAHYTVLYSTVLYCVDSIEFNLQCSKYRIQYCGNRTLYDTVLKVR